jgi:hypothetical protein
MRQLSSSLTWFLKYLFSIVWIGGVGIGTLVLLITRPFPERSGQISPELIFLIGFILGSTSIYFLCIRLKFVALEGPILVISNYLTTIRIPISEIKDVTSTILIQPTLITLHLRNSTPFGDKIVFMGPLRFFGSFIRHPLVQELTDMVQKAKTQEDPGR